MLDSKKFVERAFRNFGGEPGEQPTKTQRNLLSAAYGIYAHQMAEIDDELTAARVAVEKEKTRTVEEKVATVEQKVVIAEERSKFFLAALLSRENVRAFGQFLVQPISQWGPPKQLVLPSDDNDPAATPKSENADGKKTEGTEPKAGAADGETLKVQDKNESAEDRRRAAKEADAETLKALPWYLRTPAALLAKVFGEMSPLIAGVLMITVVLGAITFGIWTRSDVKNAMATDKATIEAQKGQMAEKDKTIESFRQVQIGHDETKRTLKTLELELEQARQNLQTARAELAAAKTTHATELRTQEQRHTASLATFASDPVKGYIDREQGLTARITQLEGERDALATRAQTAETSLNSERQTHESKTSDEANLRAQLAAAQTSYSNAFAELQTLKNTKFELEDIVRRTSGALGAVEEYFWAREGDLEVRRACFRRYYTTLMKGQEELLRRYGIRADITNDRYDMDRDPSRRLARCDSLYGK